MLTNASKYAIRAVLHLTKKMDESTKMSGKEIGSDLDIPEAFIAKIFQKLVKANIISSHKGPKGGFYMSEDNLNKNINDIIWAVEGRDIFDGCFMGLPVCSDENPCPVHHIVAPFKEKMYEKFNNLTIKDFAEEIKDNGTHLTIKGINVKI